ncbi:hypothetical protein ACOME3_007294 [Neoechinorhynchus agilis]
MDWEQASQYCRAWANGTLAVILNVDQLNYIRDQARHLALNQSSYWLIGLRADEGTNLLRWINGIPLAATDVSQFHESHRPERNKCGVLSLYGDGETLIENRPCRDNMYMFVCQYVVDHCYKNEACSPGGKCLNLVYRYKCICNFFSEGKYCKKWSSRSIQTLLATFLLVAGLAILWTVDCSHWYKKTPSTFRLSDQEN